jgi:branched-chain amino acid transport system substrate-binding protein
MVSSLTCLSRLSGAPRARLWAPLYAGLITLSVSLLLGCGKPPTPVQIGLLVDATGLNSTQGIAARNGAQFAIEQANANGGINGQPIELLFKDDASTLAAAQQAFGELINSKVEAIIGPSSSMLALQLTPYATRAGVLLISSTVMTPLLAGQDDQFFRTLSHKNPDAQQVAQHLQQDLGLVRVYAIVEESNAAYTEPWLSDFNRYLQAAGGTPVATLRFTHDGNTDYAALAQQLLAEQPQAVVLVSNGSDAALLATQLRQRQPDLTLAAAAWATASLPELGGQAVEGLITPQVFDLQDTSPAFMALQNAYVQRFKAPLNTIAILNYNAADVLVQALRQRQAEESVKQSLLRIRHFQGVQQQIDFDDFGDVDSPSTLKIIHAGQFIDAQ